MKLIYVAGRYRGATRARVQLNIEAATHMGTLVSEMGHYPVIPHTNTQHFEHLIDAHDEYFLEGTMEMMRRCDGVLLVPGYQTSSGTMAEIAEAQRLCIPVFYEVVDLAHWKWPHQNQLSQMEITQ